jgi:hypothetical protein
MAKRRKRKKQQPQDDDLTPKEWKTLMKFYSHPQPVGGIRRKGMTKARAAAFLSGLVELCEQAKEKHDA